MALERLYGLTRKQIELVRETCRHYLMLHGGGNEDGKGRIVQQRERRAVLTADLAAPSTELATMTFAAFKMLELQTDGTSVASAESYTGYNNDPDFTAANGDSVIVSWIDGRWLIRKNGGASGTQIISFSIVSSDPTIRSALVEIRQRSFTGTVYGSTLDDTVVTVYDTDGCFLNEPNVDLTGRNGKAVLMYVDAEAEAVHFPDYTVPTKYWNVISLCCPNTVCE